MTHIPEIQLGSSSDVGRVRSSNEDYHGQYQTVNGHLIIVCDGMGGHLGGATAARLAAESIRVFFDHQRYENPLEALRQAFLYANSKVATASHQSAELEGMGTTCVAALLRDGVLYHAHVGDSRLYHLSGGRLRQLTKDHTVVQDMLDQGTLTPQEVEAHPSRHMLSHALGTERGVEVAVGPQGIEAVPGDVFLFCTDGLTGVVPDAALEQMLRQPAPAAQQAERLVQAANQAGGPDNVTALVLQVEAEDAVPAVLPPLADEPAVSGFAAEQPVPQLDSEPDFPAPSAETAMKKTSSKPDIALIVLCGLAALTIGLFIAGWKYLSSTPVENSELATVQANTVPEAELEAEEMPAEAQPDEEDTKMEAAKPAEKPKAKPETVAPAKPKPAETAKPVAMPAGGTTITHLVKAGETFRGIANRYNLKYETLKSLNPQVKDVEKDMKSDVTKLNVRVKAVHTVGPGDVLSVVARKYGVAKPLLMAANKKTADRTERGEKLVVPLPEKQ